MEIKETYTFRKTFSESDVYMFGGIICDSSPWHIDEEFAKESIFKKRLVYGMLSASLFSTVIGKYFPGYIYLDQGVKFLKPVFIGDTVQARITVDSIDEKGNLTLICDCFNQDQVHVLEGIGKIRKL